MSGLLLIPEGFSVGGQTAIVDVGGVVKSFTLDPKGKSPKGNDAFAVGVKAGKTGTPLQIVTGDYRTAALVEVAQGAVQAADEAARSSASKNAHEKSERVLMFVE